MGFTTAFTLLIMSIIGAVIYIFTEEIVARTGTTKGSSISTVAFWFAVICFGGFVLEWVF